jgi:CelD/BcsL family acetyltransferase involved in cellulose biosynthesis
MKISAASLAELESYYLPGARPLLWPHPFTLPGWMAAWWQVFGSGFQELVLVFTEGNEVIGIAPLKLEGNRASFIGDPSVCDYLDFVVQPGCEDSVGHALLSELARRGLSLLELECLRPDSVASGLMGSETQFGKYARCQASDVSYEVALPDGWQKYLDLLETKQRHEVERKLRRLEQMGQPHLEVLADGDIQENDREFFFSLMTESRRDKAGFLTEEMRRFFTFAMRAMARYGLLRLGVLSLGARKVAAVLFFVYNKRVYLYNSGYDPAYRSASVGLISKLYCLRWAIENKYSTFDFLKGPEIYKKQLGGNRIDLTDCQVEMKEGYV